MSDSNNIFIRSNNENKNLACYFTLFTYSSIWVFNTIIFRYNHKKQNISFLIFLFHIQPLGYFMSDTIQWQRDYCKLTFFYRLRYWFQNLIIIHLKHCYFVNKCIEKHQSKCSFKCLKRGEKEVRGTRLNEV